MKHLSIHRYGASVLLGAAILAGGSAYAQITATNALSEQEVQGLLRMVEEEKLAGDVYQVLYERTGLRNFGNIVQSERQHQRAVQGLLQTYRITDPTAGKRAGEFANSEFTQLYQQLVTQGSRSNVDALKVGTLIEELDIADLNQLATQTKRADILRVFDNLNRGSRNHLRSFDASLKMQTPGSAYQPKHLTQSQYDSIVSSAPERGMGQGMGATTGRRGGGMGGGMGGGRNNGTGCRATQGTCSMNY